MTRNASESGKNTDERQTITDFKQAVNMTASELEKWLDSEESKRVGQKQGSEESVGHHSGRRIIELLHRPVKEYSAEDYAHMRKVVGYIHRHMAQGPTKSDPATSDWRYSLMNWGHDPQKSH
jgi:hypothetical protein